MTPDFVMPNSAVAAALIVSAFRHPKSYPLTPFEDSEPSSG
jgi:hypothetical protein